MVLGVTLAVVILGVAGVDACDMCWLPFLLVPVWREMVEELWLDENLSVVHRV